MALSAFPSGEVLEDLSEGTDHQLSAAAGYWGRKLMFL